MLSQQDRRMILGKWYINNINIKYLDNALYSILVYIYIHIIHMGRRIPKGGLRRIFQLE